MTNFQQNNLDRSSSPYLQQHKDNPVHWQEWNEETLRYAKENGLLIFVSIGYATCHWCHVMANEAFSDHDTADYLNKNFVSIKVDREQRPDIDEYFMNFVNQATGQGGWPLNVVLSPDGNPFLAGTYFPHKPKHGLRPLKDVLSDAKKWYMENHGSVREHEIARKQELFTGAIEETTIAANIYRAFDNTFGGFGTQIKFPPHSTLLLLLNFFQETKSAAAQEMILQTLDAMATRGLHDHLQGGFYRYCVDREWTIPHFEKMLYDQAMHLWVYALSFQIFKRNEDKIVIEKITRCLQETFSDQSGLFYSAHDADTEHIEGATYIWSMDELKEAMNKNEFEVFSEAYDITDAGNFEGKNHLIKKNNGAGALNKIEEKLLAERKKRPQPFTDKKIVTSWNALTGIGLLLASRYAQQEKYKRMAFAIFEEIMQRHSLRGIIAHSSLGGILQDQEFLEDRASLLLLATYIYEDAQDDVEEKKYKRIIENLLNGLDKFKVKNDRGAKWFANTSGGDFKQIFAQTFDHPIPSAVSLAEMAIFRAHKILGKADADFGYGSLLENDFHNTAAFFTKGKFHEIRAPEKIAWAKIPINALLLKDAAYKDCTAFSCHEYNSQDELINSLPTIK
ncbi:MAG: thioredoxin domain-containing protein [Candidatus Nealsonbacteria bacterium]|nr:thioredoxin domain-containing protein [Candidatus Nealsonbacteria bacterium]